MRERERERRERGGGGGGTPCLESEIKSEGRRKS